jgi:hypothetical protein
MAAGVGNEGALIAGGAVKLEGGADFRAAVLDGGERVQVFGAQTIAVFLEELRLEGFDHGGQADHLIFPQVRVKPPIKALMRSIACCLV